MELQIQNLMRLLKIKDDEARKGLIFRETEKIDMKLQLKNISNEN